MQSGDDIFMRRALHAASRAAQRDEVPVGAVAVYGGAVIGTASNRIERSGDATAHAELVLLRRVAHQLGTWRLQGVTLFVTLEPCPMCAGAMVQARIDRCVYGARDPKKGADGSVYDVLQHPRNNHRIAVTADVLSTECGAVLSDFFRQLRSKPTERD